MSPMPAMDSGIATGALFRAASSCGSELERVQLDTRARVQSHESLFVYTKKSLFVYCRIRPES